jgi:solute carrier family 25 (mitochondrial S-adenosylmethionine transporter), member 26
MMTSILAGGAAGAVCDVALHPIDTLKTRLQANGRLNTQAKLNYRNMFVGVYNGIGIVACFSAPASALFFAFYDSLKKQLPPSPYSHALAAGLADIPAAILRVPMEVIKQRTQAHTTSSVTCFYTMRSMWQSGGAKVFFTGFTACVMRDVPFSLIQFPIYEWLKLKSSENSLNGQNASPLLASSFGALSGAIAAAATCPLDVLKTRRMLGDRDITILGIFRNEGIPSLFRGVVPRVAWISAGGCIWLGTYEKVKLYLDSKNEGFYNTLR